MTIDWFCTCYSCELDDGFDGHCYAIKSSYLKINTWSLASASALRETPIGIFVEDTTECTFE